MEDSTREVVGIGIALVTFSILVSIIAYMTGLGQNLATIGKDKEAFNNELAIQREMSVFDNREMTGDDVLRTVKEYTKAFDMLIEVDSDAPDGGISHIGNKLYIILNSEDHEDYWSTNRLRKLMAESVSLEYTVSLDKDSNGDILGITFTRKQAEG